MNQDTGPTLLGRAGRALTLVGAWPGRVASWLILPMLLCVLAAVAGGLLRVNELMSWDGEIPLFGSRLAITGLAELQWHFLALLVMLGGAYALAEDRHVSVDLLSARFPGRVNAAIRLVGDVALLAPFCWFVMTYSVDFAEMAWRTGEHSNNGGLTDRWLAKSLLPIGMGLMLVVGLGRVLLSLDRLITGHDHEAAHKRQDEVPHG